MQKEFIFSKKNSMFAHITICIYIYNLNYRLKITKYEKKCFDFLVKEGYNIVAFRG